MTDPTPFKKPRKVGPRVRDNSQDNAEAEKVEQSRRSDEDEVLPEFLPAGKDFFRDKEVWDFLEKNVIPTLFAVKNISEKVVRVWIVGCGTGEEAYSMAILLHEYAKRLTFSPKVQIFATDSDSQAIEMAREGIYPETITTEISFERLRQFFIPNGKNFQVCADIRESIFFGAHDLFKDPPFSRVDMILCRNFESLPDNQSPEKMLDLFNFALNPRGFLLLDSAGPVGAIKTSPLFSAVKVECHLYKRRAKSKSFENGATLAVVERPDPEYLNLGGAGFYEIHPDLPKNKQVMSSDELHRKILENFGPASVLIDEKFDIIHLSDQAGRYLQIQGGAPSFNLVRLVHPDLRLDLRVSLYKAIQNKKANETRCLPLTLNVTPKLVRITVRPVTGPPSLKGYILVTFDEIEESSENHTSAYSLDGVAQDLALKVLQGESLANQLEEENEFLKEKLESIIGQYETSLEEVRVSNEELQGVNEELHSASDDLESSRLELQAVNSELLAVNSELNLRLDEISYINSDLQNLIVSTDIATIFLNRQLRIKRYTPQVEHLFNIIPTDLERPLFNLTHRLDYQELIPDINKVLRDLAPITRQVKAEGDKWYLVRVLPYRTIEDRIDGVVLTFTDITERTKAQESVRESEERFRLLITASSDVLYRMSADWVHKYNLKGLEFVADANKPSKTWLEHYIPPEDQDFLMAKVREAIETKSTFELEHRIYEADGTIGWTASRAIPVLNEQNEIIEWFGAASDITERKRAEMAARVARQQTSDILESITDAFYALDKDWRITYVNAKAAQYWQQKGNPLGKNFWDYFDTEIAGTNGYKMHQKVMTERVPATFESAIPEFDFWTEANIYPSADGGISVYFRDITERKRREAHLAFMAEISEILATQSSSDEIMQAVGAKIGAFLKVTFAYVVEFFEEKGRDEARLYYIWNTADMRPLPQTIHLSDFVNDEFNQASRAGKTVVLRDTETDPIADKEAYRALGMRAFVTVPFHKDGIWKYVFVVSDARPRDWHEDEVRLIEELSNRVFPRLERSLAETALRESEASFRHLFDVMDQGYVNCEVVRNETGKVIDIIFLDLNAAGEQFFGVKRENVIGHKLNEWLPVDNYLLELFSKVVTSGKPERVENYAVRAGRWYEAFITPVGENRFISLFTDSTVRKNQEVAVRESAASLRVNLSVGEIGSWQQSLTRDEIILDLGMRHLLGLPETTDVITTEAFRKLIYEEDQLFLREKINLCISEGSDLEVEFRVVRPDGAVIWLKERGKIVNDTTGNPVMLTGASVDITEQKQAQTE